MCLLELISYLFIYFLLTRPCVHVLCHVACLPLPLSFIIKFTRLLALVSNLLLEPFLEIQNSISPKYCVSSSVSTEVSYFLKDSPGIYMIFPLGQMISKTALPTSSF